MSAWNCLAPGGILLVIAHHTDNLADASAARRTPTCYSDRDVIADLGAIDCSARVERTERAARAVAGNDRPRAGHGGPRPQARARLLIRRCPVQLP